MPLRSHKVVLYFTIVALLFNVPFVGLHAAEHFYSDAHAISAHAHAASEHPHATGMHPHAAGEHPHAAGEHPHATGTHPHATGTHPHATGTHPHATGTHDFQSHEHSHHSLGLVTDEASDQHPQSDIHFCHICKLSAKLNALIPSYQIAFLQPQFFTRHNSVKAQPHHRSTAQKLFVIRGPPATT